MNFSIYLNRRVFEMQVCRSGNRLKKGGWGGGGGVGVAGPKSVSFMN